MRIISKSLTDTKRIGAMLARGLKPPSVVALFGELGSGKTVLVKGMARALGIRAEDVVSPTFVLVREYKGKFALYHFDLYRLNKKKGARHLGLDDYLFGNGISVIEWADRIEDDLPKGYLRVEISIIDKNKRLIKIRKQCGY